MTNIQDPAADGLSLRSLWQPPTISPEHGVYIVLLGSFLTGVAAAHQWNWATTLALICAFCGFQAEHPLILQIRQRKSFKIRFWLWGGIYGGIATAIALYLYGHLYHLTGDLRSPLISIYLGAIVALIIDGISVFRREQKSILNEVITFTAVCLSAPFAYVVTTGHLSPLAIGLWLLNTLYFSTTIFLVKLRKPVRYTGRLTPKQWAIVYPILAIVLLAAIVGLGLLPFLTALAFSIALFKLGAVLGLQSRYCAASIQSVALLETLTAILFLLITSLSILPAHLPS